HAIAVGKAAHCLHKTHAIHLHHKVKDIAGGPASKAFIDPQAGRNVKGSRTLVMKGTQAFPAAAGTLQFYVVFYYLNDISGTAYFFFFLIGYHGCHSIGL